MGLPLLQERRRRECEENREPYSGVDAFFASLDEDGDLARPLGFEDLRELGDGFLENLGRADVDLGDNDHDGNVERESEAEVLPALGRREC